MRRAVPAGRSREAALDQVAAQSAPGESRLRPAGPLPETRTATREPARKSAPQFVTPGKIASAKENRGRTERAATGKTSASAPAALATAAAPQTLSEDSEQDLTTTPVETSAACTALLASLTTANETLRCEIATALGKLGDKQALVPLERYMGDSDVRVRRAVAGALAQLGHPKGETLLSIAERKPAAVMVSPPRPSKARKSSGGGAGLDGATVKMAGGALLALALVGGGIWYWMNSAPSTGTRRKPAKSAAAKKIEAKNRKTTRPAE